MLQWRNPSVLAAILAAVLFGASPPIAKLLLPGAEPTTGVEPIPLAALVYLGSGCAMLIVKLVQRLAGHSGTAEARLVRQDIPWLTGAVVTGGVIAPISLMLGLQSTPAATASLLLNFEGVATAVIASLLFKEAVGGRIGWAIASITAASIVLSVNVGGHWGISLGAIGVLAACVFWGMDNNLTRRISARDPLTIVMIKGLAAGVFSLLLAKATGSHLPGWRLALIAMAYGSISYGLSIVFFILALRGLGAARTGAFFGSAPFVGAVASLVVFRTVPDFRFWVSVPLMLLGGFLLVTEEHGHWHTHGPIEHEHSHSHNDDHHSHDHNPQCEQHSRKHSHRHTHAPHSHSHPHTPDDHHRHTH